MSNSIDIDRFLLIGNYVRSKNERFTLAWQDGGPSQSRTGRYLLLDGKEIVVEGKMARPNDGKVNDGGIFVLNDWAAPPLETLRGTFYAFGPDGRKLVTRVFRALLYSNFLSDDGRFAVCACGSAPTEDDGLLTVFDLPAGRAIAEFKPESGPAQSYMVFPETRRVRFIYDDGETSDYSFEGEFFDRMKWLLAGLKKAFLGSVEMLIDETSGKPTPGLVAELLPATDTALLKLRADDKWTRKTRARVLKLRGICLEAVAELKQALACYEEALSLDPGVGVKRRADRLRKVA